MSQADITQQSISAADEDVRRGRSYWRYFGGKCLGAAISLVVVVLLSFFAFRILPGNPVATLTHGREVTPGQLAQLRTSFGLDKPLYVQFFIYLNQLAHLNLGTSYVYRASVSSLIGTFVGPTLLLMGLSSVISILLGVWIGQKAAWKRDGWFDRASSGIALVMWSVPAFWLGLLLLLVFAGVIPIFPSAGMTTAGANYTGFAYVLDVIRHLVLPTATLVAVTTAQFSLIMRASLLEEMSSDYLVTARAKGLTDDRVRRDHAIPNALLPTVTIVFLQMAFLIGGAVTVETVFSWPGLGYLTFQALQGPDLPLLQGTFVVFSSIVIIFNLAADLVYRAIDPRVRTA